MRIFDLIEKRLEYESSKIIGELERVINDSSIPYAEKEETILDLLSLMHTNKSRLEIWRGFLPNAVDNAG